MLLRNMALLPPFGRRPRGGLGRGWLLRLYREGLCRAWLGTTPGSLPLAAGLGRGWLLRLHRERPCRALLGTTGPSPVYGRGVGARGLLGLCRERSSAEHGSALRLAPSLWPQAEGRVGEGLAVEASPGTPLPSIARHYAWLPPFGRRPRGGLGRGWLLRLHRERPCRAWLGTTPGSLPLAAGRGEGRGGVGF